MLKRRARWRTWLGLKGEVWYFEDSTPEKTADKPHRITVKLALLSPLLALVAAIVSIGSFWVSRQSLEVGQRAYISISDFSAHIDNNNLTLDCSVENQGNTPAKDLIVDYSLSADKKADDISLQEDEKQDNEDVGPKEKFRSHIVELLDYYPELNGLKVLYIQGYVRYTDVFNNYHVVETCWSLSSGTKTEALCGHNETDVIDRDSSWAMRIKDLFSRSRKD